jgi:RES domain-containing protein
MAEYRVEVTRTVELTIEATSARHATDEAFIIAWGWQPERASGGDQGQVSAQVVTDG